MRRRVTGQCYFSSSSSSSTTWREKWWGVRGSSSSSSKSCMGWRLLFVGLYTMLLFITSPTHQAAAIRKGTHHHLHPSSNWVNYTQELKSSTPLRLDITRAHVVMDNGLVRVTLTNPTGGIAEIQYHGIRNVLEYDFKETNRGYWDIVWSRPGIGTGGANFDMLPATRFRVITSDQNQIEVSFTKRYDPNDHSSVPLNIDKRYVMLPRQSGFYTYAIYEHLKGWPDVDIGEARVAIKLQRKLFNYMAISDDIQRKMPNDNDRSNGQTLDYKEAVLLTNPSNPSGR